MAASIVLDAVLFALFERIQSGRFAEDIRRSFDCFREGTPDAGAFLGFTTMAANMLAQSIGGSAMRQFQSSVKPEYSTRSSRGHD